MDNIEFMTRTDFEATVVIDDCLRAFSELNILICEKLPKDYNPLFQANHLLFASNVMKTISAYELVLKGFYSSAMAIMRVVWEGSLSIRLFNLRPEKAELWIKQQDKFYSEYKHGNYLDIVFGSKKEGLRLDFEKWYSEITKYVHPATQGNLDCIIPIEPPTKAAVTTLPRYIPLRAMDCLGVILFILKQLGKSVLETFSELVKDEIEFLEDLNSIGDDIDEESDDLKNNFEEIMKKRQKHVDCLVKLEDKNEKSPD